MAAEVNVGRMTATRLASRGHWEAVETEDVKVEADEMPEVAVIDGAAAGQSVEDMQYAVPEAEIQSEADNGAGHPMAVAVGGAVRFDESRKDSVEDSDQWEGSRNAEVWCTRIVVDRNSVAEDVLGEDKVEGARWLEMDNFVSDGHTPGWPEADAVDLVRVAGPRGMTESASKVASEGRPVPQNRTGAGDLEPLSVCNRDTVVQHETRIWWHHSP